MKSARQRRKKKSKLRTLRTLRFFATKRFIKSALRSSYALQDAQKALARWKKDAAIRKSLFDALDAITIKPISPFRRTSALLFATTLRICNCTCDARAMN